MTKSFADHLDYRFGNAAPLVLPDEVPASWTTLAARGSCRKFEAERLDPGLIRTLAALALAAPSKSDLQQRDIVLIVEEALRARLNLLLTTGPLAQPWIEAVPHLLVFCGNHRRQRQLHEQRGRPFVNDHLDAFFNAALDAGIALAQFVTAAEAIGLGCCPVSAIRNHAAEVSSLLALPDHVFPVAGLALGRPAGPPEISPRLPLAQTFHTDRYDEGDAAAAIAAYDARRRAVQPYAKQRYVEAFGEAPDYGWSEDKARQYAKPERADFGGFVRQKGFRLD
jgi:nitroreductase/FMN reductase [NAD(P)H]